MAAGMATGEAWFKVPAAIRFHLTGKLPRSCSGKDVILTIIGKIGLVDDALEIVERRSIRFPHDGPQSVADKLAEAIREVLTAAQVLWAIYDISIKNYAFFVFDILTIVSNLVAIFLMVRKGGKRGGEAEPGKAVQ